MVKFTLIISEKPNAATRIAQALAEGIVKAINTKWDHKAIAEWVKTNFSWDMWAREMDAVLRSC